MLFADYLSSMTAFNVFCNLGEIERLGSSTCMNMGAAYLPADSTCVIMEYTVYEFVFYIGSMHHIRISVFFCPRLYILLYAGRLIQMLMGLLSLLCGAPSGEAL